MNIDDLHEIDIQAVYPNRSTRCHFMASSLGGIPVHGIMNYYREDLDIHEEAEAALRNAELFPDYDSDDTESDGAHSLRTLAEDLQDMRVRVYGDDQEPYYHEESEPSMKKDLGSVPISPAFYTETVFRPIPLPASRTSFLPHAPYTLVQSDPMQPNWFVEVEYFAMPTVVELLDETEDLVIKAVDDSTEDIRRRDLEEDIARAHSTASDLRAERDWLLARLNELTAQRSDIVADISSVQESVRHLAVSKALAVKSLYGTRDFRLNVLRLILWSCYVQLFERQQACLAHMHAQMRQMLSFGLFVDWQREENIATSRRIAVREDEVWALEWRMWELNRERNRVYARSEAERKKRGKGKRAWARDARGVGPLRDEINEARLAVNKLRVQASQGGTERYLRALFDTRLRSRRALKDKLKNAEEYCTEYRDLYRGNQVKYQYSLIEMGTLEKEVKDMEGTWDAIVKEKEEVLGKIRVMQGSTTPATTTTPATGSSSVASSAPSTMPAGSSSTGPPSTPADPNAADMKRLLESRNMLMGMLPYDLVALKKEVESVKAKVEVARRRVYFGGQ